MSDETLDDWLSEQITYANNARHESRSIAPNSYGAGYDQGRYDGMQETFTKLRELWGYSFPEWGVVMPISRRIGWTKMIFEWREAKRRELLG